MKKIIIFTHGGGRFANQFTNFANFIAFAKENNFAIINIAFNDFSPLIENYKFYETVKYNFDKEEFKGCYLIKLFNFSKNRIYRKFIIRLLHLYAFLSSNYQSILFNKKSILRFLNGKKIEEINLSDKKTLELFSQKTTTIIAGWGLRDWNLLEKKQSLIKTELKFNEKYQIISDDFINNIREKHNLLIGVFMRQTDYKTYTKGKYYLDTEEYIALIEKLKKRYSNRNVAFIVASDEPKNIKEFKNLPVYFSTGIMGGDGHYIESFIQLGMCDSVLTVPSTFSGWATFMGNSKIIPIYDKNILVSEKEYFNNNIFDAINDDYFKNVVK